MVTGLEIKNLIQSHEYKRLLDKAEHEYGIKIYDNDESISQECNSIANEINKSGLTPELILDFIIENDKKERHNISNNIRNTGIRNITKFA